MAFFAVNVAIEIISFFLHLGLWARQRGKQDLKNVKNCDCKLSCALIFFRIFWTIGLSIFMLTGVIQLESGKDPYKRLTHGSVNVRNKELNVLFKVTMLTLILESV